MANANANLFQSGLGDFPCAPPCWSPPSPSPPAGCPPPPPPTSHHHPPPTTPSSSPSPLSWPPLQQEEVNPPDCSCGRTSHCSWYQRPILSLSGSRSSSSFWTELSDLFSNPIQCIGYLSIFTFYFLQSAFSVSLTLLHCYLQYFFRSPFHLVCLSVPSNILQLRTHGIDR